MVNFASAADFVADNSTAEGRRENQRVDIELNRRKRQKPAHDQSRAHKSEGLEPGTRGAQMVLGSS
jgi:hypothetical protein